MDEQKTKDHDALNPSTWLQQHGDYLYRYALSRLRGAEAAEEVVQETFVAGLRAVGQYEGKGAERAWLLGILKRKIIDYVRRRSRTSSLDAADSADEVCDAMFDAKGFWRKDRVIFGTGPGASLEKQEFWIAVRGCLDTLPQRQADVFTLREMDEKSTEDICKDLEITPSNLWVLLHRARLRLAHCMKTKWQDQGETSL